MIGLGSPYSHATPSTTGGVVVAGGTQEPGSGIPSRHATSGTPGGDVMSVVMPGRLININTSCTAPGTPVPGCSTTASNRPGPYLENSFGPPEGTWDEQVDEAEREKALSKSLENLNVTKGVEPEKPKPLRKEVYTTEDESRSCNDSDSFQRVNRRRRRNSRVLYRQRKRLSLERTPNHSPSRQEKRKKDQNSTTTSTQEKPPQKKIRRSYAESVKDKIKCEIRADIKSTDLDQTDFGWIASELMFKALEQTDPQPVDITRGSLNKGRIEFWVESQKSVDFLRETIPTISPNTEEKKTHKYMFLGPGEHITRFVNAWVPRDFAKPGKIDKLGAVIRMQNAALRTITETDTGQTRPSIIRVAKLVDSTKMMMPGGHVLITLELEEDLWTPLSS